jgi:hypothetical protein
MVSEKLRRLAAGGLVKLGLPNRADLYRQPRTSLPDAVIDAALGWTRGGR